MSKEYYIQPGDSFHGIAQRLGGTCEDFLLVNPKIDPMKLQIGQKIVLPEFKDAPQGQSQFADIGVDRGQGFVGDYLDEVEMEIEGIHVRVRRIGEPKLPHEIHFLLPRTEIRKIQPAGECGPIDTQIMLSNINVVLSPRLMSDNGDRAEQGRLAVPASDQTQTQTQTQTQPQNRNHPRIQTTITGNHASAPSQFEATSPSEQGAHPMSEPSQGSAQVSNQPKWRMSFPFK